MFLFVFPRQESIEILGKYENKVLIFDLSYLCSLKSLITITTRAEIFKQKNTQKIDYLLYYIVLYIKNMIFDIKSDGLTI